MQAPTVPVPYITTTQMIEVDRLMIEELGITLLQMMENAGRQLAILARDRFLDGRPEHRKVVVLAGTGGNGGGAMVAARRLHGWGARVGVLLTKEPEALTGVPAQQVAILKRMGVPVLVAPDVINLPAPELIIDGIIGYSLNGAPRARAAQLITWARTCMAQTLSLDVPSGLDLNTGRAHDPCIRAVATMTLALPKSGLRDGPGGVNVGELYLADIGVPPQLHAQLGLSSEPLFARSDLLRLY